MPHEINETHNPDLRSWVESANDPNTDFPIQNLPLCTFEALPVDDMGRLPTTPPGEDDETIRSVGVLIGDHVLDLYECAAQDLIEPDPEGWLDEEEYDDLSLLLDLPAEVMSHLRRAASDILNKDGRSTRRKRVEKFRLVRPVSSVRLIQPCVVPNYTDFYASVHHATNVGSMFRPDQPLLPNYKWVPIGYHGRASSIVVSGTEIRRPLGQTKADDAAAPSFGPCRMLDYELELGFYIGRGNEQGRPIPIDEAHEAIVGLCLVNDWSARDMQKWEYQPLGPFLAKNFATTVSPCIVTCEALAPFRCAVSQRPAGDPAPLPHLWSERDQRAGGFDIVMEAYIASAEMRSRGMAPMMLSRGNARELYWSLAQMVAHHSSNGCNLTGGDLIASGTVSGPTPDSRGCLLELTWAGPGAPRRAIQLPTGETRTFLADGDEVIFRAFCERPGFRRIGFGECRGVVTPALA